MIVRKLLPIKAHFFFFMAALGPVLPQLQVMGKQLGVSSVIMGTVTGILPLAYILAKPLFGLIVDVYREYRKMIFMSLLIIMAVSYSCMIFIPLRPLMHYSLTTESVEKCEHLLPIIAAPKNIFKELKEVLSYNGIYLFFIFAIIAGIVDGFITYFLLWYVEDIASETTTDNVKLLEGFIIAAETFGGEILFFYIGDNILAKLGHIHCFSVCFLCYGLRLGLISQVSSPWYIIIIEFFCQGPSYALTYLTIVAYANDIAPKGASATMQGIAAGLDDGLGYALGSLLGGILYRYYGSRQAFQIFCVISVASGVLHYVLQKHSSKVSLSEGPTEASNYSAVSQSINS